MISSAKHPPTQLVFSILLLAVGCEPSSTERLSETQEAVAYGQPSGPSDDGVVFLESLANNGRIWRCTGTLVAPNLVLTARHCVASFQTGYWSCDSQGNLVGSTNGAGQMGVLDDPSNIYVVGGSSVRIGPRVTPAAKGVSIFAAQTSTVCINDLALVVLDTQLTNLPYLPLRLYSGAQPGENVRVVGYGADEDGGLGVRHTKSGLTIAKVGTSQFRPVGDAIPPRTFMTEGPAFCTVDSGGPAFSDEGAVIGVFSEISGTCTASNATNFFSEVAPFAQDVILPAFVAAGYEPWLEGNSEPGLYGTGGTGNTGGDSSIGGSNASGGAPLTSASGGSTSSNNASGGEPVGTGGDTSRPGVYDQGPPSGGSCACRTAMNRRSGLGALLAIAAVLGLRRRRLTTQTSSG